MGQRQGLSTTDVDKLWTVYQCYGGQMGQMGQCSYASRVERFCLGIWLLASSQISNIVLE